jgi:hypothetical protein
MKTPHHRGRNALIADTQKIVSGDGERSALGRNVKRSIADRRFDAVQAWTLKEKREGKWVVVATHRDVDEAEKWTGVQWDPSKHSTSKR